MIQVRALTKVFPQGPKAVDELDLTVNDGEILGLLGPNGAGKTTTIRVLSTLCGFDSGSVTVAGHDVDKEPEKVRQSIGLVAQNTGIDYFLTGRENLELQGQMYRMKKADIKTRIEELANYFELSDSLDRTVATYSGGMRRKLDIATALIHRPKLVFLDEPTLGLDIKSRKMLWNYIEKLNKEWGITILLTTHYLEEADKLADRVAIINAGQISVVDTPEALKNAISGDAISLSFEKRDAACQQYAAALQQNAHVKDLMWQGNNLHIYVDRGADCIPEITALATQHGARILTLGLSRPTLDDVFLRYTGTSMEGSADDGDSGDEWWKQWAGKGGGGKWEKQWSEGQQEGEGGDWQGNDWSQEGGGDWQGNDWSQASATDTNTAAEQPRPAQQDASAQPGQADKKPEQTTAATQSEADQSDAQDQKDWPRDSGKEWPNKQWPSDK